MVHALYKLHITTMFWGHDKLDAIKDVTKYRYRKLYTTNGP